MANFMLYIFLKNIEKNVSSLKQILHFLAKRKILKTVLGFSQDGHKPVRTVAS